MDNRTDISDYDLFLDQGNETANNAGYNVTQENCNLSSNTHSHSYLYRLPILEWISKTTLD